MIVGLVTSWREGNLAAGAARSLRPACDMVLVLDAPLAGVDVDGPATNWAPVVREGRVLVRADGNAMARESDAAKRTELVQWAQTVHRRRAAREPLWLVWCDADELLLWGEWLPDYIERAGEEVTRNGAGGFPLRHVEADGSVHYSWGRVIDGLQVRQYLHSGYQVELTSGMVVALPLTPLCTAGGIPLAPEAGIPADEQERDRWLGVNRPPLQGEPHIVHRHALRSGRRSAVRGGALEQEWFERQTP